MSKKVDRADLALSKIRTDGGTQPREVLDCDAVNDYMDAMEAGAKFPPVDVFHDGAIYWLAHGFHRYRATEQAGRKSIPCEIHQGTQQEAQWYSYSTNQTNGLRRTNADKQRAVKAALLHPNGLKFSDRQIAEHVGVDDKTVAAWREKLRPSSEIPKIRSVTRKGKTYQQDTSRIGKGRKAETRGEHKQAIPDPVSKSSGTGKRAATLGVVAAKRRMIDGLLSIEQTCTDMQRLGVERVTTGLNEKGYEEVYRTSIRAADRMRTFHEAVTKRLEDSMPWNQPSKPEEGYEIAAKAVGVSVADIKRAECIKEADPEAFARVWRGESTLDAECERLFKTPGSKGKAKGA